MASFVRLLKLENKSVEILHISEFRNSQLRLKTLNTSVLSEMKQIDQLDPQSCLKKSTDQIISMFFFSHLQKADAQD